MINQIEIKKLMSELFGSKVMRISPLSSAVHAESYKIMLDNEMTYVVKTSPHSLDEEAQMLQTLHDKGGLPTPKVYHASSQVLVMEYIHSDWQMNDAAQADAGTKLARLHKTKGDRYGYTSDTHIASILQSNAMTDSWADFFINNRLLHMAELAFRNRKIDQDTMHKIDLLASKAHGIIGQGNRPVLIHGDCWGGNILSDQGEVRAFIDPAIYYADHEMVLAFLTLFNTVNQSFFASYQKEIDIKPGFFEERRVLYNIYPLLVHTILFGASYARRVSQAIKTFL